jgi:hypothetical protein
VSESPVRRSVSSCYFGGAASETVLAGKQMPSLGSDR